MEPKTYMILSEIGEIEIFRKTVTLIENELFIAETANKEKPYRLYSKIEVDELFETWKLIKLTREEYNELKKTNSFNYSLYQAINGRDSERVRICRKK